MTSIRWMMGSAVLFVCKSKQSYNNFVNEYDDNYLLYLVLEVLDGDILTSLLQLLICPADDLTFHYWCSIRIQLAKIL